MTSMTSLPNTTSTAVTSSMSSNHSSDGTTVSDKGPVLGKALILLLCAVVMWVIAGLLLLFLWKKRKRFYIPCTCRSCIGWVEKRKERFSTTFRRLTVEYNTYVDIPEPRQERILFSIEDQDNGEDDRTSILEDDDFYDDILYI